MLIGAEVGAAALGTSFAVDVGVDVVFEVADDGGRQAGQRTGVDALACARPLPIEMRKRIKRTQNKREVFLVFKDTPLRLDLVSGTVKIAWTNVRKRTMWRTESMRG